MTKGPKPRPPAERLWAKVDKAGPIPTHAPHLGPCWLWTGKKDENGYGRLAVGSLIDGTRGKHVRVHRVAYESAKGPIPEGLVIDHLCRVHACVRPDHLEAVTHAENVMRGLHGALKPDLCKHGHPFVLNGNGVRYCRTCARARYAKWYYSQAR